MPNRHKGLGMLAHFFHLWQRTFTAPLKFLRWNLLFLEKEILFGNQHIFQGPVHKLWGWNLETMSLMFDLGVSKNRGTPKS